MKPCTRVGIDSTYRCHASCNQCFYRWKHDFFRDEDVPIEQVRQKIDESRSGGLDHVVFVGYGEPTLGKTTPWIVDYAHSLGMATSMITTGATGLNRFQRLVRRGIDHFHISSHGLDGTLDEIMDRKGAFRKQAELKEWLRLEGVPFRTNVAMQQANFRELPNLAEYEIEQGVFHFVFLGMLPHYEWGQPAHREDLLEVAVHPAHLRPYIQEGADVLLGKGSDLYSNCYFTIRYHPLCHLSPKYWPYVTNARYVLFDPFEWNYALQAHDPQSLWTYSVALGESVAVEGPPCSICLAYRHCGGWNRTYAAAFDGADLTPIMDIPDEYADVWDRDGGLFDLNPVNHLSGTIRKDAQ